MKKEFITDTEKDPALTKICFTDDDKPDYFCMEIFCTNEINCNQLKRSILGSKKLFEMDGPNQNFEANFTEQQGSTIKITGNLFNVLNIFEIHKRISSSLHEEIVSDQEMISFLENSKKAGALGNKKNIEKKDQVLFKPSTKNEKTSRQDAKQKKHRGIKSCITDEKKPGTDLTGETNISGSKNRAYK